MNLGLGRTTRLTNLISKKCYQENVFQPPWQVVHIAGTNGKGSVAAYLATLLRIVTLPGMDQDESSKRTTKLRNRPLRVGRYTSPHIIDRWDCIVVNDTSVSEETFNDAEAEAKLLARQVENELLEEKRRLFAQQYTNHGGTSVVSKEMAESWTRDARPTQFEILTATAFKIFSDPTPSSCDIAVIECGIGGQLDATNILPASSKVVTIITRIGLDHLDMLGGNLRSIVSAKCGILRQGVPVVVDGDNTEEVLTMIKEEIHQKFGKDWARNMLFYASGKDLQKYLYESQQHNNQIASDSQSPTTEARSQHPRFRSLMPHQLTNLAMAVKALEIMTKFETSSQLLIGSSSPSAEILEEVIHKTSISYPARLQMLQPGWLDRLPGHKFMELNAHNLLLDGAHNEQSALVLRDFIAQATQKSGKRTPRGTIYILALSSTKPPIDILQALFPDSTSLSSLGDPTTTSPESTDDTRASTKLVFTLFKPPPSMSWVKPTTLETLSSAVSQLGLSKSVMGYTSDILEALDLVESHLALLTLETRNKGTTEEPLIVIAGSLYLASNFLKFLRDGRT